MKSYVGKGTLPMEASVEEVIKAATGMGRVF